MTKKWLFEEQFIYYLLNIRRLQWFFYRRVNIEGFGALSLFLCTDGLWRVISRHRQLCSGPDSDLWWLMGVKKLWAVARFIPGIIAGHSRALTTHTIPFLAYIGIYHDVSNNRKVRLVYIHIIFIKFDTLW